MALVGQSGAGKSTIISLLMRFYNVTDGLIKADGVDINSFDLGSYRQNIGIVPEHRGRGLGSLLLLKALQGFQRARLQKAFLEVTAQNSGAIKLYRRLGFLKARTVYKVVEVAYS